MVEHQTNELLAHGLAIVNWVRPEFVGHEKPRDSVMAALEPTRLDA